MAKCSTRGCTDTAKTLGFCPSCYSFHKYWEKRGLKARIEHAKKLNKQAKRKRANDLVVIVNSRKANGS